MSKKETKRCSVPGCQRKHKAKGLCNKHYIRQARTGAWVKPKKDKKKCSEEGCTADAVAKGLCNKHYKRMKKNGDTKETRRYGTKKCSVRGCYNDHSYGGYCSKHAQRLKRTGSLGKSEEAKKGEAKKFFDEVVRMYHDGELTNECILWPFALDEGGYAQMIEGGETKRVHNLILRKTVGEPPNAEQCCALHASHDICGNRNCINPLHLRWGSVQENVDDRAVDGTNAVGEKSVNTHLTDADVRGIRELAATGEYTKAAISRAYGISRTTCRNIIDGKTWRHLLEEED